MKIKKTNSIEARQARDKYRKKKTFSKRVKDLATHKKIRVKFGDLERQYEYECLRCGECCRGTFAITIEERDIVLWKELGKEELLDHVQLLPESIAMKDEHGIHLKEGRGIKWLRNNYPAHQVLSRISELRQFIEKTHLYFGESKTLEAVYSIFPNMRWTPIFLPKKFDAVLEGLQRGLKYAILTDSYGKCPFLHLNDCLIQEYKPYCCQKFPYDRRGHLKIDDYRLEKCKGLKRRTDSQSKQ